MKRMGKILQFFKFLIIFLHSVESDFSIKCNDTSRINNRYVSKNNFNSFCDNEEMRGDPRIEHCQIKRRTCSLMTVDTDGNLHFFLFYFLKNMVKEN